MSVADIINYTYQDYKNWKGDWELIEGMPIAMVPAPMVKHQNIASKIISILDNSLEENDCKDCYIANEVDWKISDDTILRPDVVVVCDKDELDKAHLTKSPKLIVEVISPSTAKKDEKIKYEIYEKEGVDYYLLVYPDDLKAKVYQLIEGRYRKVGDFTKEVFKSNTLECDVSIDFEKVFRKFR